MSRAFSILRGTLVVGALVLLSACGNFRVAYEPVSQGAASTWSLAAVRVAAPATLVIHDSDNDEMIPRADVVWHGTTDPERLAGAVAIVKAGITEGARALPGRRKVVIEATLTRFHALTDTAYYHAPAGTGVYSVSFVATVRDARTGEVLAGPQPIEADLPAPVLADGGVPADKAAVVAMQRGSITRHVAAVVRGWLGLGADPRGSFARLGASRPAAPASGPLGGGLGY